MAIKTKDGEPLLYEEESYLLRGLWMDLYNAIGPGHKETTYGNGFEEYLKRRDFAYEREKRLPILLDGKIIGWYVADFIVFDKIIVELKSVSFIPEVFIKKLNQYLKSSEYKLGFIVNFGAAKLEIIRQINERCKY
ncbi:MAG: GxxExxY protein [Parcubacteria group bacterium]